MPTRSTRLALVTALVLASAAPQVTAQGMLIGGDNIGLGIGDVPRMTGVRLNLRDRALERIDGVNITILQPYEDAKVSHIRGIALGLPLTGGGDIEGFATGLLGVGAKGRLQGIAIAPIGVGAGGSSEGLLVGGIGVGGGGNLTGIAIGGIGVGAGGRMKGLLIGGVGVGGGGDIEGIALGGVGVGTGGNITGLAIGGLGVGAGGTITGLAIGGLGVGAPIIRGVALSAVAGGAQEMHGFALSTGWFKIEKGELRGGSVAAYNEIRGVQHGLTLGIVNLAEELHGVQLGLINIALNNAAGRKVLPIVNWHE